MGGDGMSAINTYLIRGTSPEELHAALVATSIGKARAFAWDADRFDDARVRLPYPETAPGATDPETGAATEVPTGMWLCEVVLVDEEDAILAAMQG